MIDKLDELPISRKSLATQLGISTTTVLRYVKQGMPHKYKGYRKLEFNLAECQNWLYSRKK